MEIEKDLKGKVFHLYTEVLGLMFKIRMSKSDNPYQAKFILIVYNPVLEDNR